MGNWKKTSTTSKIHNFIRKMAHGLEFFVLSRGNINNVDLVIRTLFIVVMFAILDEYLQSYVPGRGTVVSDILIDFWGGVFGVLVFKIVNKIVCRKEEKNNKRKEIKIG